VSVLSKLKNRFPQRGFVRNVSVLAGGTALGQGIVILASPILTRLYTPEDFGILAVYTAILGIVVVMASLRYELAIPLPKEHSLAANLLVGALALIGIISLLTVMAIWSFGHSIVQLTNTPLLPYLWLIPIGVALTGSLQVFSYWASRNGQFTLIAYTKSLQGAGLVGVQLLAGLFGMGPLGLIAGTIVGGAVGLGMLIRRRTPIAPDTSNRGVLTALGRYRKFPLYNLWGALMNVGGLQAAPLLLASFFSPAVAGYYSLTLRVLSLPAALVGQAVGQVFYPTVAKGLHNQDVTRSLVVKTATALLSISLPVFLIITLVGPELFRFVFGADWEQAGTYASLLAPWLLLSFVSSPLSTFVLAKEKQRQAFLITLYETGLRIGALAVGAFFSSSLLAVGLYSAAGWLISFIYIGWILRLAGSSYGQWLAPIKSYLVLLITIVALPWALALLIEALNWRFIGALAILIIAMPAAYRQLRGVMSVPRPVGEHSG
jgi:O-antigen/teichoic acid export membrane protein